jgi:hypothetical protein
MKTNKEMQEEINRLTIAYQNASDQRQHYVEKCLKLSEVVLELSSVIDFTIKQSGLSSDYNLKCRELSGKHKDLINQLKQNLGG